MRPVVVIPTLNEAANILRVINQLSVPLRNGELPEIWVMDALSSDGTSDLVRGLARDDVTLLENRQLTQAHALNLAAKRARDQGNIDVLVRIDAHASYPDHYIQGLLNTLAETEADSVVVPLKTVGGGPTRDAAAILFGSWLGNGGSPHRSGLVRGFVDHGHHAAFLLDAFLSVGGYDTGFRANEDAEFDYRLTSSGRRIFLEPDLMVDYIPRNTVRATFRQYARNGKGRMQRARKHGVRLGLRQLAPSLLLPVLIATILLGLFFSPALFVIPVAYLLGILASAILLSRRAGRAGLFWRICGLATAAHLGFSFGASREWVRSSLDRGYRNRLSRDDDRLIPASVR
ncbi:MAG: glycosyltransferase family 2 protein [Pseudomonadota bacterium]